MTNPKKTWTNRDVEALLGNLLRIGVVVAASVVSIGGAIYLAKYGGQPFDYRVFKGEPSDLRSVYGILLDAANLRSRGLIQLGLLLLIATPIARVAFSVVAFLEQRDYAFVLITLFVLSLLVFSLSGGHL